MTGSLSHLGSDFLIVDQSTAREYGLHAGQQVIAHLPDGKAPRLRVAAVVKAGSPEQTAYVPAADASGALPAFIAVTARAGANPRTVGRLLRAAARGHAAEVMPTSLYLTALLAGKQAQTRQAITVILGTALIYCLIAVAITLIMAAAGRRRELAALGLAGATRPQALRFIAAESALVVLVGGILAAGASIIVAAGQHAALTRFAADASVALPWASVAAITAACAAIAVLTAILSARHVLKETINDLAGLRE